MQVILAGCFVVLPGAAGKAALDLRGLVAVDGVTPDVVIAVGVLAALAAFHKPGVLVARMVDNEVHDDLQAQAVSRGEHAVKVFHRAELVHNGTVVADIVAVVVVRALIHGRQPQHVYAELRKVRQARSDAV